jgi:hypothetical protein
MRSEQWLLFGSFAVNSTMLIANLFGLFFDINREGVLFLSCEITGC